MKVFIIGALCLLGLLSHTEAQGRAFPISAENYIIERFQQINSGIKYDHTNFLVDLSGYYAGCAYLDRHGFVSVDRQTRKGDPIQAIVDSVRGYETHEGAVAGYIRTLVDDWARNPDYIKQIYQADRFGCSVRPGCSGSAVVACLFSPSYQPPEPIISNPRFTSSAVAFTPQQYTLTEKITGAKWDRSHFLENVSGLETSCSMITKKDWVFTEAEKASRERGIVINGLSDYAPNYGNTEAAMVKILRGFKKLRDAREVGCSVIPDCEGIPEYKGQKFVVVACLYKENIFYR